MKLLERIRVRIRELKALAYLLDRFDGHAR